MQNYALQTPHTNAEQRLELQRLGLIPHIPLHPIVHIRIHITRRVLLKACARRPRRAIPNKFIGKPRRRALERERRLRRMPQRQRREAQPDD